MKYCLQLYKNNKQGNYIIYKIIVQQQTGTKKIIEDLGSVKFVTNQNKNYVMLNIIRFKYWLTQNITISPRLFRILKI